MLSDAWEAEAENWVRWARTPGHDSYWSFHRDAFVALRPAPGRLTLDVGCGEGRLARDLTALGHRVIGLDRSPTLVRSAASAGGAVGAVLADGAHLPVADAAADLVVAFMSLQDMDDMQGCVWELARVLVPGGHACFAVTHPVNTGHVIDRSNPARWVIEAGAYWAQRRFADTVERDGLRMTFHSRHRNLQDYFEGLEAVGLLTEAVREPRGTGEGSHNFPWFLHVRARKPA